MPNLKEHELNSPRFAKFVVLTFATALLLTVAAGCGGKPQYCIDRSTLESSVKDLPSAATSGGVSALKAQVATVKSDANTLVSSAKADFPTQTSDIDSSIKQLQDSIKLLPAEPSTVQLAAIGLNATAVVNSVSAFTTATNESCK